MPVRFGQQRWMRQPDSLTFVDHAHPLAQGFSHPKAFFYVMSPAHAYGPGTSLYSGADVTLYDLAGNQHDSRVSGHANVLLASPEGYSSDTSSSGPFNTGVLIDGTINGQGTIYWGQKPFDAFNAGTITGIWGANTGGSSPELTAQRFSDNNLYVGWNGFSGDNRVTVANQAKWWGYGNWAFVWVSGQKSRLYHNGVLIGTASSNSTVGTFTGGNTFRVGERPLAAAFNGRFYYFGLSSVAHTTAQVEAFADNPYQIFQRARRYWAFDVAVTGNTIAVPAGSLTLTGFAPTVVQTANNVIAVPAGSLTLTGQTPTVVVSGGSPQTISVPAGSLTLTGFAPVIVQTANNVIQVPAGTLTLAGQTPTVLATANNVVSVPLGTLTLSPYAPVVNPVVATGSVGVVTGGGPSPKRRKPHFVEIDGELFPVEDEAEAIAILQQAQELHEEIVQKAVVLKAKPPAKPVIKASVSVAETVQAIDARHAEIERAYQQMLDDDDEDVLLLL